MPERSIHKKLQESFPATGKSDWLNIASTEVNGNNPQHVLAWNIEPDTNFLPYYDKTDTQPIVYQNLLKAPAGTNSFLGQRAWYNLPVITVLDEKTANQAALDRLSSGADGVLFELQKKNTDLSVLLKNIEWPFCYLAFIVPRDSVIFEEINAYCNNNGYREEEIKCSIFHRDPPVLTREQFETTVAFKQIQSSGIFITNTSPTQEIADALIQGARLSDNLIQKNIAPELAIRSIAFSIPVQTNFLADIAKLKALRMLWYQIARVYQCNDFQPSHLHIHVRSEKWINESYQPHGNMLKCTTASIAAICGGCDSLSVYAEQESNPLMQRIASNVSALLREESYMNKVSDPVAGSYAIEIMVNDLAKSAWEKFQRDITN
jgi:methylmalonyl-CoA mutase